MTTTPSWGTTRDWVNLMLIALCWCFGMSGMFIQISTTSVAIAEVEGKRDLATVPIGSMMFTAGLCGYIIPHAIERYGHTRVFFTATLGGVASSSVAMVAMLSRSSVLLLLTLAAIPQGFTVACTTYLRLAVARTVPPERESLGISVVVLGGAAAAGLGPELSLQMRDVLSEKFAGSYLLLLIIMACYCATVLCIRFDKHKPLSQSVIAPMSEVQVEARTSEVKITPNPPRPLASLVAQPNFLFLSMCQAIAFSGMAGLMSVTPLAMKDKGHSFAQSTFAVQMHILGMYVPSLVTGYLLGKVGANAMICIGFAILSTGSGLFLVNSSVEIFTIALTLVGVGWNFAYVAASSRIKYTGTPAELPRLLGVNELIVLMFVAVTVSSSSFHLSGTGFTKLVYVYTLYHLFALAASVVYAGLNARPKKTQAIQS